MWMAQCESADFLSFSPTASQGEAQYISHVPIHHAQQLVIQLQDQAG